MKRAFTLVELLVVVIIVGILAGLGYSSYRGALGKGHSAEAKANLAVLRQLERSYYVENNDVYVAMNNGTGDTLNAGLPLSPAACDYVCNDPNYYFEYLCDTTGSCSACRCTTGGKPSPVSGNYTLSLTPGGTFSCSSGTCP